MATSIEFSFPDEHVADLRSAMVLTEILTRPRKAAGNGQFFPELLVGRIEGLKVYIKNLEHAPPHVHVKCNDEEVRYRIDNGNRLPQDRGLEKYDHDIRNWLAKHRRKMIIDWNSTRPGDCPVGPMSAPQESE